MKEYVQEGTLDNTVHTPCKKSFIRIFNCEQIVLKTDVKHNWGLRPVLSVLLTKLCWRLYSLFSLKTLWQGSFHFLLQNEGIGLVRSKTS
jgi:hypothetical protein